jgi:RNA recognition motif-containing protein
VAKKIYVGHLPFQTTEADLNNMFSEVGQVESVQIITDRDTGRSKGFGFVEMRDDAAAVKAIEKFNGQEVNGRALNVNEARPKASSASAPGGGRDRGGRGQGGYGRY